MNLLKWKVEDGSRESTSYILTTNERIELICFVDGRGRHLIFELSPFPGILLEILIINGMHFLMVEYDLIVPMEDKSGKLMYTLFGL